MPHDLSGLRAALARDHALLADHPVFAAVETLDDLRRFMETHVFAVWDFMTLLKRLQRDLTTPTLPWTPPANRRAARLVNEIVLGEETDVAPGGGHMSHFELYLEAMAEIGADTGPIERFLAGLAEGRSPAEALAVAEVPLPAARFVRATLATALHGTLPEVLGSFFHGRENVIPAMFRGLLARWRIDRAQAPTLVFYLERHIELDGDEHGPAAEAMIEAIVGADETIGRALLAAARTAVAERVALWDGVLAGIASTRLLESA